MKGKGFVVLVATVLMALAFVPAAVAAPPIHVEGDWELDGALSIWILEKVAGGNYFWTGTEYTGAASGWTGDFAGTSVDHFRAIAHKSGVANARFTIYFTGTVCGSEPGTMVLEMGLVYTTTGRMEGSWVIKDAAGGLEGLHGEGSICIDWDPMGSYTGKVHWQK